MHALHNEQYRTSRTHHKALGDRMPHIQAVPIGMHRPDEEAEGRLAA